MKHRHSKSAWGAAARLVLTFIVIAALFVVLRPLFILCNLQAFEGIGLKDWADAMVHGFAMDLSAAAYLSAFPALLYIVRIWVRGKWLRAVAVGYCAVIAALVAGIVVVDAALYPYWDFRLDTTPIFYFTTSPSAVIGGLSAGQLLGGTAAWLLAGCAFFFVYRFAIARQLGEVDVEGRRRWWATLLSALAMGLLFIPMRGGVTVSTMNPSRAYFSDNQRLNHASLNPAFNLLYSATHQSRQSRQFRFMDAAEADSLRGWLDETYFSPADSLTAEPLFAVERPDIYLVILESFSAHLLPAMGGEPIAQRLDSIAREGLLFSNFYANSFRTDRALTAILSSYPAMPTASIMKRVDKMERLPSWTQQMRRMGYDAAYYYGGDVNFANMKALLVSNGFIRIVCDNDFPIGQRLGKWGAHDDVLFRRVLADEAADTCASPRLRVVQTSSSHEPFDVPYSKLDNPALNAFAFTDSVVGAFVDSLSRSPRWDNTVVVLVADHYGCYPRGITDPEERHHIPLVLTGGALARRGVVDTYGSQVDLAATILGALGAVPDGNPYSHNLLLSPGGYAFVTDPEFATILTPSSRMVYNIPSRRVEGDTTLTAPAQAILQSIYEAYDN